MKHRKKNDTVENFNNTAMQTGLTYAEAQRRETISGMGRIRAPRGEDGETTYMKVSARNTLRNMQKQTGGTY